jgi:hypothetical protein
MAAARARQDGGGVSVDAPTLEPLLLPGETLLDAAPVRARMGARSRAVRVRGVFGVSNRRVLFAGDRGARFGAALESVAEPHAIQTPGGRLDLGFALPDGDVRIEGVSAVVLELLGVTTVSQPAAARPGPATFVHAAAPVGAAVLWFAALARVDAGDVSDLGIVSALPLAAFAALALATVSFAALIARREPRDGLALIHVVALIAMLYGATGAIGDVPSFSVTWRHAGVAEHIAEHGSVDRAIDAYFNWPGFFALAAAASEVAGLDNPIGLARWSPVALNLLYLAPLVVIVRSASADWRVVWSAAWIFFATNWVGQDYFSPQGLAFALYLVLLAVLLTWFPGRASGERRLGWRLRERLDRLSGFRFALAPLDEPPLRAGQRAALVGVCAVAAVAAVFSHQLTPFAMIATVGTMVVLGRCSVGGLPLFLVVAVGGWLTFAAGPYLEGHIDVLKGEVGQVGSNLSSSVGDRVQGSDEHTVVVYFRIGLTAFVWALGGAGALMILLRRARWPTAALIFLAPLALVFLQGYGGEILLRIYMFVLPFAAVFAAALVTAAGRRRPWLTGCTAAAVGALLLGGFLFARYGNERINLFTDQELATIERLYDTAPEGSVLVSANPNIAWQGQAYAEYDYVVLSRELPDLLEEKGTLDLSAETAALIAEKREDAEDAGYVIFTRSTRYYDELLGEQPWGSTSELERELAASPRFRRVYSNADGAIFQLTGRGT